LGTDRNPVTTLIERLHRLDLLGHGNGEGVRVCRGDAVARLQFSRAASTGQT
jgi:hypothetical protein